MSTHFCGDPQIVEVIFRTRISVNQLSIYGAAADMCANWPRGFLIVLQSLGDLLRRTNQ